ncbi:unnamed protein product [Vitrella brassicaformis CCMP3155]|uniref:Aquaporin n=2 Tax=Vitrella brassicaformis TaxID=1169539 RepID=A0A0G4EY46_VITBC|nr:unnamed protein product [Vitrella brassicaformis CCMP3155]|mmetsp:Transcript_54109/g.136171  ORF Transcript_54109/g.136171 Transcript_54109/m.136171 type:complete len:233 (+) Transcript_54109:103-801(+)|eukprot:CEM03350.1 unnamed protein product [Vitrella brassicaformis CCMP3155]
MAELAVEKYVAECIGTFFLVLTIGCCVINGVPFAPLAIGGILMVMIFAMGSVSGAHFNPAVTTSVLISGRQKITPQDACLYMLAQLVGGLLAGLVYWYLTGLTFALAPGKTHNWLDASVAEMFFTCALCFVVLNTATTKEDSPNHYFGLAIGFTVMASAFAIGSISGASLNPAVSFGSLMVHGIRTGGGWVYFPLYLLVPFVGSALAAGLFYLVRPAEYGWKRAEGDYRQIR